MGLTLTHTRLPVLRRPVPAAALAPVAARHVQADGEGAALAQTLGALVHVWRNGRHPVFGVRLLPAWGAMSCPKLPVPHLPLHPRNAPAALARPQFPPDSPKSLCSAGWPRGCDAVAHPSAPNGCSHHGGRRGAATPPSSAPTHLGSPVRPCGTQPRTRTCTPSPRWAGSGPSPRTRASRRGRGSPADSRHRLRTRRGVGGGKCLGDAASDYSHLYLTQALLPCHGTRVPCRDPLSCHPHCRPPARARSALPQAAWLAPPGGHPAGG